MINICLNMLYILILCPVLLAYPVLTLTIDSQLGTSVEDCFERVSIGEQLCVDAIYRNETELSTKECEQICKQDTQCQTYDYGVGAKGNASCSLSKLNLTELQGSKMVQKHSDYDVYVRRVQCESSSLPVSQPLQPDSPQNPLVKPSKAERRPQADDPSPLVTLRPDPRPYPSYGDKDRPDGYDSSMPTYDGPPSYGMHRPQDVPYRPDNSFYRPNQNDEMNFNSRPNNWRPPRPNDKIPEIYKPRPYPNYIPEQPQYVYIDRPHRRPRPSSCSQHTQSDDSLSDSATSSDKPIGPPERPERPYRPYNKPTYSSSGQYASNYGTSEDNSIYLEIIDPPRPIRPVSDEQGNSPQRPSQPYYCNHELAGYGQEAFEHSSQNYYSQHGGSQQSWNGGYMPTRPYRNPPLDHGPNYNYDDRYRPARPIGTNIEQYGQNNYNQASYSESHSSQNYASSHGYYGSGYDDYNRRPNAQSDVNKNQSNYVDRLSDMSHGHASYGQGSYGGQSYGDRYSSSYSGPSIDEINKYNYEHGIYGTHLGYGTHHLYGITPGMYGPSYYNDRPNDRPTSPYEDRPSYNQDFDKLPYGHGIAGQNDNRPVEKPNRPRPGKPDDKEVDNKNKTNTTVNNTSTRPDVKPVYEQDVDRPYNVPSYLVTSNGDVVTSKPVAVSDFRLRPGYRREEVTYEGKMS